MIYKKENGEVPEYKASIWMERFLELTKDYEPADNWMNMDETG